MLYVVEKTTQMILAKWDAWERNAYEKAMKFVEDTGLEKVDEEITFMGDMVVWVA